MPQTGNPIAGHWWIQSMHPYRVQQASSSIRRRTGGFNPRIHTGCDNKESNYIYTRMTFQSTHPYRMRRHDGQKVELCIIVSIHAPIQGATYQSQSSLNVLSVFQSTHPYRVRPQSFQSMYVRNIVSIHAPIQGATLWEYPNNAAIWFQSTHPYRVRLITGEGPMIKGQFQSTHPYRVRLGTVGRIRQRKLVSIHAPIQGATVYAIIPCKPTY